MSCRVLFLPLWWEECDLAAVQFHIAPDRTEHVNNFMDFRFRGNDNVNGGG